MIHKIDDRTRAVMETVRRNIAFIATPKYEAELDMLESLLGDYGGRRLLDVGIGAGGVLRRVSRRGVSYVGIDISRTAVAMARALPVPRQSKRVCFVADVQRRIPSPGFDSVVMSHVIEHLEHPAVALKNVYEAMNPWGRLVVLTPNAWFCRAHWPTNWIRGYKKDPTTVRYYTAKMMHKLLTSVGFSVTSLFTFGPKYLWWNERVIALGTKIV